MKRMNKKIAMVLMALLLGTALPVKAQILIMDDEFEGTSRTAYQDFGLLSPLQGTDGDQFTPLGDGWLLLFGMGSAYMLKKGRKKKKG